MGKIRNSHKILVGKPEGKRTLGRPKRTCEYNIRMDLREIGWAGVDCGCLWLRWAPINTVMNFRVP
jgi:hypothetical protein